METFEIFLNCPNLFGTFDRMTAGQTSGPGFHIMYRSVSGKAVVSFNSAKDYSQGRYYGSSPLTFSVYQPVDSNNVTATENEDKFVYEATIQHTAFRVNEAWNTTYSHRLAIEYIRTKERIISELQKTVKLTNTSQSSSFNDEEVKAIFAAETKLREALCELLTTEGLTKLTPYEFTAPVNHNGTQMPTVVTVGGEVSSNTRTPTVITTGARNIVLNYELSKNYNFAIQTEAGNIEQHVRGNYTYRQRNQSYTNSTNGTLRLEGPLSLRLRLTRDDKGVKAGVTAAHLSITRGGTTKRRARGGWGGPFVGLNRLSHGGQTVLEFKASSGNPNATIKLPVNYTDLPTIQAANRLSLPVGLEDFKEEFKRPEIDVKPTLIGHLNFYRIGDAPVHIPYATNMSDLIMPSMAYVMVSVKHATVATQSEDYVSGEVCQGDCSDENELSVGLPPGLYLVERELLCGQGHDPGRQEYTSGFGDYCNERLSVLGLLSRLMVSFDNTRISSVGAGETVSTDFGFDDLALSGLDRF